MALFVTNKTQVQDLIIVSYKLQDNICKCEARIWLQCIQAGTVRWQSRMETQGIGLIFKFQVSSFNTSVKFSMDFYQ